MRPASGAPGSISGMPGSPVRISWRIPVRSYELFAAYRLLLAARERGRNLAHEALELRKRVRAREADTQIGDACSLVTLERVDDGSRRAETHETAEIDAAAVILPEEVRR